MAAGREGLSEVQHHALGAAGDDVLQENRNLCHYRSVTKPGGNSALRL
jgi:hypothetical protein